MARIRQGRDDTIKIYYYTLASVFGACIGSFINVVVYRLPRGIFLKSDRSYCPACDKIILIRDLVPVISYIHLKGRCRFCGARISMRYPIIEALAMTLALLCCFQFGFSSQAVTAFCYSMVLLAVAVIDSDTMEIPDSLIMCLAILALAAIWLFPTSFTERIIGFFAVSLPMFIMAYAIPGAFGGGDIKLMAVCGFFLGWKLLLTAFFIAIVSGGARAVFLIISGGAKRGEHMAFGPFLCAGVFSAFFWGDIIISAYLSFLR